MAVPDGSILSLSAVLICEENGSNSDIFPPRISFLSPLGEPAVVPPFLSLPRLLPSSLAANPRIRSHRSSRELGSEQARGKPAHSKLPMRLQASFPPRRWRIHMTRVRSSHRWRNTLALWADPLVIGGNRLGMTATPSEARLDLRLPLRGARRLEGVAAGRRRPRVRPRSRWPGVHLRLGTQPSQSASGSSWHPCGGSEYQSLRPAHHASSHSAGSTLRLRWRGWADQISGATTPQCARFRRFLLLFLLCRTPARCHRELPGRRS